MTRIEAVLFVAKQPLHARKIAHYANLADGTEARTLMLGLNQIYDRTGCAFRIIEVAGGWQLRTRRQFANWLRRLPNVPAEIRFSAPSMETLAVIAYRQPVTRADVERVRGVSCGEIIRQLMERDLVNVAGRSEELGRPYLYGTTKRFLELFGLQEIAGLPRFAQMQQVSDDVQEMIQSDPEPAATANKPVSVHESSKRGDVAVKATASTEDLREIQAINGLSEAAQAFADNDEIEEDWDDEEDDWDDDDDEDDDWDDDDDDDDDDDEEEVEDEIEDEGEDDEWEEVDDDDWDDDDDDFDDDDFDDDDDDDDWEDEEELDD